ncbi:hypothetical protein N665_3598s0002 [Sinapis alba]|nr:hypothetical protein N665_3598s0002 [Sinapis alba]
MLVPPVSEINSSTRYSYPHYHRDITPTGRFDRLGSGWKRTISILNRTDLQAHQDAPTSGAPSKDRIISWGLSTNPLCLLCNSHHETRDHLFFSCHFSSSVWESLARKAHCLAIIPWAQVINYMQDLRGPKHRRLLALLAWQSAIYFIWTERNNRLHRQQFRSPSSIILSASSLIKNKISSLRHSSPSLSSRMIQLWLNS